jgi:hypothetical protein
MAMGIPVICNSGVGDTERVVRNYHSGIVIDDFNSNTFKQADIDFLDFDRDKTILGAAEFYGLDEGVKKYEQVYRKLLG